MEEIQQCSVFAELDLWILLWKLVEVLQRDDKLFPAQVQFDHLPFEATRVNRLLPEKNIILILSTSNQTIFSKNIASHRIEVT